MQKKNPSLIKLSTIAIFFYFVAIFSAKTSADAQESEKVKEETRLLDHEITKELEEIKITPPKLDEVITFRSGGWLSSVIRNYENDDNNKNAGDTVKKSYWDDIRLWAQLTFLRKHQLYARVKNSYIKRATGSGYSGIGDDYEGPLLDVGYLKLNFDNLKIPTTLTVGRQYLYLGRAISYSDTHDGIKIIAIKNNFFLKSFFSMTKPHDDNIDLSVPDYDKHGERIFVGTEFAYLGMKSNIIYAYGLFSKDQADQNTTTQSYNYNSGHFGLGYEGALNKNYRYWTEIIKQRGSSYTDSQAVTVEKKEIDAWAWNLGLKYYFRNQFKTRLEFEYFYGSGDKDRTKVNYTSGGGNKYGRDKNFNYFGDFAAGYALSPRLSNLMCWKAEASIRPFPRMNFTKDIITGMKLWIYRKDKAEGGIYDTDATGLDKDIGREINFYTYWNITNNIHWSVRYGIFFPRKSYPAENRADTKYLYTRLTIVF